MSNERKPRLVASHAEVFAIYNKLREVCAAHDGEAVYAEGWDNERVRREVAPRLLVHHVHRMRTESIGPLKKPDVEADLRTEVRDLRVLIVTLYERLNEPLPQPAE